MSRRFQLNKVASLVLVSAVLLGSAALISAPRSPFRKTERAAYADPNLVDFVRPGLVIRILSAEIAADGTIKARVRFTDQRGLPLDRAGIATPGVISPGLVAAYIPRGGKLYTAYTTRVQRSTITGQSATQAGADSGGTWAQVADGEYVYTFATKAPQGFDRTALHTIGVYANRNLAEFELGVNLADAVFHFVPDGSQPGAPRDVIKTATCNKCHYNMAFHGETGRKSMEVCVLCHTPQTTDPDTGNTVDMTVMTHKIHMGEHLPSVVGGKPYRIIGFGNAVADYSHIAFPSDLRTCTVCHEQGKGAAQENAWLQPSRAACGSCHDNVNFATGEGHVNLPQVSDSQCATCHTPQGELEFDASIKGAHTIPRESAMLGGLNYEIVRVDDGSAGKRPVVTFRLTDKKGQPLQISQMQRLALVLAGPTTDYTAFQTGYISEDLTGKTLPGSAGTYTYTFTNAIPADAKGTYSIGIEGRREEKVLEGTRQEQTIRYGAPNKVVHFSVDGSPLVARRQVVTIEKCNACHTRLVLHGENRESIQQCVLCHNPKETDALRRPAADNPAQSVHMAYMIHRIHGGEEVSQAFGTDYVVYGFGGSKNDFSEVRYPAPLTACSMCHVNGSENLPLAAGASAVNNPRFVLNPSGPNTTPCVGCHQSVEAASHALANTTRLGESCGACHSQSAEFSVGRVHAQE